MGLHVSQTTGNRHYINSKSTAFLLFHHSMEFTMMCQVDNVLRNLKVLFAAGDPFAAEKATETWQKYELL